MGLFHFGHTGISTPSCCSKSVFCKPTDFCEKKLIYNSSASPSNVKSDNMAAMRYREDDDNAATTSKAKLNLVRTWHRSYLNLRILIGLVEGQESLHVVESRGIFSCSSCLLCFKSFAISIFIFALFMTFYKSSSDSFYFDLMEEILP